MHVLVRFTLLLTALFFQPVFAEQTCQTDYPQTTPSSQFEVHGDGTVTDKKTKLIWKRCVQGLSGNNCSEGTAINVNWEQALQEADNNSDWRLPNIKELQSIVEKQCANPALNTQIFPGDSTGSNVWSSSPNAYYTHYAWYVYFGYGYSYNDTRDYAFQVRLVRSGQ